MSTISCIATRDGNAHVDSTVIELLIYTADDFSPKNAPVIQPTVERLRAPEIAMCDARITMRRTSILGQWTEQRGGKSGLLWFVDA